MKNTKTGHLPHPIIWLILYIPFGALGGFVQVALTFLATKNGLSITEGALIVGSQMLVNWLKWLWAPAIDITLTPKRWFVISTVLSGVGVFAMASIPLGKETLWLLLLIVALSNVVNSVVGMAVEAMIASLVPRSEVGRASGWLQAGNLGGTGLGGGLGLLLLQILPSPWMTGAIMAFIFVACCLALLPLPHVKAHVTEASPLMAVRSVAVGFWQMVRERTGTLSAILCALPIATGAAQMVLTQAAVAGFWGAGAAQVELVQGLLAGLIMALGCFVGGWVCHRTRAMYAYPSFGLALAAIAAAMALSPATVTMYVFWNMIYAFAVGLSYSAFSAMSLFALNQTAAATGYNIFASLSNFPIWWLGLLLGWVADHFGARNMLLTESAFATTGVAVFILLDRIVMRIRPSPLARSAG